MPYTAEVRFPVRYSETDMMGIVHHSRYYPWFEAARCKFSADIGVTFDKMNELGFTTPVTETGARYFHGATFGDEVTVKCRLTALSPARCTFEFEVYRDSDNTLLTTGFTKHGFVNLELRPINLKKTFPDVWKALENSLTK